MLDHTRHHMRNPRRLPDNHRRDYYGGALMLLLGLGATAKGLSYDVGTLSEMGPGFFPVALGVILTLAGLGIAGAAASTPPETDAVRVRPEWRGWVCILGGILAFIALGQYGGLLPATFVAVFISAMGDRQNTIKSALALACAISVVSVAVFWWALQVQMPLFQWG
jgi:hypothetical protein